MKNIEEILNTIHDIIMDKDGRRPTSEELVETYKSLPRSIKSDFEEWGANDTETREATYRFLSPSQCSQ